ncbi:hypothetical protein BSAF29S_04358 [Bacillus safensis subsp. safensis]
MKIAEKLIIARAVLVSMMPAEVSCGHKKQVLKRNYGYDNTYAITFIRIKSAR